MENIGNEKFIYNLISHMKEFGYWFDCEIYFNDRCWSDFDHCFSDKPFVLIEKMEDVYIYSIINSYNVGGDIVIYLYGRKGGLLYRDCENPLLCDLSCEIEKYMRNHQNMYYGHNFEVAGGRADGRVAFFALERFLFKNGKIIVDMNGDDNGHHIITIADI